mmetsp:Transcript_6622/g.7616  ORF Transcript_6622/g.7616 Transcript_6622/m.7616 type:complete len:80 (+) Transcript_6622:84-323(+)
MILRLMVYYDRRTWSLFVHEAFFVGSESIISGCDDAMSGQRGKGRDGTRLLYNRDRMQWYHLQKGTHSLLLQERAIYHK